MFNIFKKIKRNEIGNPKIYEPIHYWDKISGPIIMTENLSNQVKNIMTYIQPLDFESVYELGVGEGRISEPILESKDITRYDGSDLSNLRINTIRKKLKRFPQFNVEYGQFQDIHPNRTYDLVLASEVLMHITPEEIKGVIKQMLEMAEKYVINIDYWEPEESKELAKHNFLHDYVKIYSELGYTVLKYELPHNQSLFIVKKTK